MCQFYTEDIMHEEQLEEEEIKHMEEEPHVEKETTHKPVPRSQPQKRIKLKLIHKKGRKSTKPSQSNVNDENALDEGPTDDDEETEDEINETTNILQNVNDDDDTKQSDPQTLMNKWTVWTNIFV